MKKTETCGQRIKRSLQLRRMKQSELCKMANIPKSSLSLYMSDAYEPKKERLISIANALDVSVFWLMGFDVPMERTAFVDPDDAEFLSSLPPLSLKEELPKEIVALNEFLYPFGHQIMRTNGKYYMDEAGELTEEELSDLLNAVSIAAKNASDLLIAKRSKELLSFLKPKR